ncbi:MAG: hypothetical protein K0U37_02880 [Gammaproteobacteria bacterium]|nr:hypothetical protein [Gammaproteobacteria bacterium]
MKNNKRLFWAVISALGFMFSTVLFAENEMVSGAGPLFEIALYNNGGMPKFSLAADRTIGLVYIVTNKTQYTRTLAWQSQGPAVTQASGIAGFCDAPNFVLPPGASCILSLVIDGALMKGRPILNGPEVTQVGSTIKVASQTSYDDSMQIYPVQAQGCDGPACPSRQAPINCSQVVIFSGNAEGCWQQCEDQYEYDPVMHSCPQYCLGGTYNTQTQECTCRSSGNACAIT